LKDLASITLSFLILDLIEGKTNEKNDPFNDLMNDFELPQTNEGQKKITLSNTTTINE